MTSVASQLIEEITAYSQSDGLEDAREICSDGTYFPNNLRINQSHGTYKKHLYLFKCSVSRCLCTLETGTIFQLMSGFITNRI